MKLATLNLMVLAFSTGLIGLLDAGPVRAGYGDSDYDCGDSGVLDEYTQGEIENVAYSKDNGLFHYPGLEDLGYVKRNNLTFWVPTSFASWEVSHPTYSERQYLAVFSAGAQGVGLFGEGGRPNVTTGQRDQWSENFGGGPDRLYRDVCNRGLYGRISGDPLVRFPPDRTMFVVNFDNRYLWTDEAGDVQELVDAWVTYIKSLASPVRLKGIYLAGASMGGGLMAEIAAGLQQSGGGWELVPVIVQGMDPVLGKERLGTPYPLDSLGTLVDNLASSDPEHYFVRANPGNSTAFFDAFPFKTKLRINTIIGGGVVKNPYDVRAYSYVQPAPYVNDYDLTWMRQTSVDIDHAVIGRNWNAPIVAGTGTFDSHRAMDHWRDSYTELDMRGEPVFFALDDSYFGGPGSHGVEHDWGDIQNSGSPFYTATDRSPVVLHESSLGTTHTVTVYRNITTHADRLISFKITAPPYAVGPTAVYGLDYVILSSGPIPEEYPMMPAEGIHISMLPGELSTSFVVKTVYNDAVEDDEHVYLEIADGDFVGIGGGVQQGLLMRIQDHNHDSPPVWGAKEEKMLPAMPCGGVGGVDDGVTDEDTCQLAGGVWTTPKKKGKCICPPPDVPKRKASPQRTDRPIRANPGNQDPIQDS